MAPPAPSNVWTPHPRQCPLTGPKSHSKTFEAPRKAPPLLGGLGSYPPHRAAQNESTRREQDLGYRRHQPGRTQKHRGQRSEEHTSELQSRFDLVCRLLLEKKTH